MLIPITDELRSHCKEIVSHNYTVFEWSEIESDDTFQSPCFCGGFDATEQAFCFSYFDDRGSEFWFQFSLAEANKIALNHNVKLSGSLVE